MRKKLSLEYVIRKPTIKNEHPPLLILLHGYGSNEQDLFSFASELPNELLIISARAPQTLGMGSYSWYTIHFDMNNGKFSDNEEAKASCDLIATFIDEVKETYHTNPSKTFLLGFSQGTILSYAVSLKYPNKVQHVIALSGYINQEIIPQNLNPESYKNLDYYISHGSVDQVIPVVWAQKSAPFLNNLGIKNSYQEYMVGHGVAPQNFYDFKKWIEDRL